MTYSWLARTDPRDVARVESKTVIVTQEQRSAVPVRRDGGTGNLGRWMSPEEFAKAKAQRFPGCMMGEMERVSLRPARGKMSYLPSENLVLPPLPQAGPCM